MPDPASLRPFHADDLIALQAIRQAAFAPIFESFREIVGDEIARLAFAGADAEQAKLLEGLCAPQSGHHVFVATVAGEIAGFVSFMIHDSPRIGEIGLNAVDPARAGKGLGVWMYDQVLARMKEQGVPLATVGVGGDASHAPAQAAYRKAGFGPAIPSTYLYKLL